MSTLAITTMEGRAFEGVESFRVHADVRVEVSPSPARLPGSTPDEIEHIERHWSSLAEANPRLYNGPVLSVVSIDLELGVIHGRRDDFKRLLAQPRVATGVRLLAVTGVVIASDTRGTPHALLARRGEKTRIYPGMWELAPCGGVSPPHPSDPVIAMEGLRAAVHEEASEELNLSMDVGRCVGLVRDRVAFSDDLVFECDAGDLDRVRETLRTSWECPEVAWVALDEIEVFDRTHATSIILPTRAMFRLLGWIAD